MSNHDYVTLDALNNAMHDAAILNGITITSSRGKSCDVKMNTWTHDNSEHAVINIDGAKSHGTIVDNDNDGGITFGRFVYCVLLALNCKLKTQDGKYHELNINNDMWYANNPQSELFGKLVDVTSGYVIC